MKKVCTVALLMAVSLAHAHRVNIFTQVQDQKVVCECFYNDGKPVKNQNIRAVTLGGSVIAEGKTDDDGMFSFTPNIREDLKILLDAGMGHIAETTMEKEDLPEVKKKVNVEKQKQSASVVKKNEIPEQDNHIDEKRLREIVEQVVDEKVGSVIDLIQKQQRTYSLTTIIGGVGYIVGIFGLLMFWMSRKKR